MSRVRELTIEVQRLKSAISAIHDRLHADDVNGAHEACECALSGGTAAQPNLTERDGSNSMTFAVSFNELADRSGMHACCVMLLPSATTPGATSLQLCGEVSACKVVESMIRGSASTYMGDHAK